jgi:hypothetical protein
MIHRKCPPFALFAVALVGACAKTYTPSNCVQSVRILAIRADAPYASPGATVHLDVLAADGRPSKPAPMTISWIKQACENPPHDNYYECFPSFAGEFKEGADLTSDLPAGTSFTTQLSADIISSHLGTSGGDLYGLSIVFAMACAGHVEYQPSLARGTPDGVPFGCFDSSEHQLGPNDFVFSYARIYSFPDRANANPVIDKLMFGGNTADVDSGVTVRHCTASSVQDCSTTAVDTVVAPSSQELDPGTLDANGNPLKEEIWVDYYVAGTQFVNDTEVLYDPVTGRLTGTEDDLYAPREIGGMQLWAVVHDNRGGVNWLNVPLSAN